MSNTKKSHYIIKDEQKRWIFRVALAFAVNGLLLMWILFGNFPQTSLPIGLIVICAYAIAGALFMRQWLKNGFDTGVWRNTALGVVVGLISIPFIWMLIVLIFFSQGIEMPTFGRILTPLEGLILSPFMTLLGWGIVGLLLSGCLVSLIILGMAPVSTHDLKSQSNPITSYEAAIASLEALKKAESLLPLLEESHTHWMTHGQKTDKVLVIFHGLSNCPHQFYELGQIFYDAGYNVVIGRFPETVHVSRDPKHLVFRAEELRAMADSTVDIAHGLGKHIYVMGLSGGGTAAAFVAQYRKDVERVVTIAPFFGLGYAPTWLNEWCISLLTRLPSIPVRGPTMIPYAYMGNTTKAMGETMRLGEAVRREAVNNPMLAGSLVMVNNNKDAIVSNIMSRAMLELWRSHGADAQEFVFDVKYGLAHDVVDIHDPAHNTELVYPILFDLMEGRTPSLS
jgi:pimeloyl-ACP methyl ester carboxylesterase